MTDSTVLPAVPKPGSPVTANEIAALERQVAETIQGLDDVQVISEWRDQARALEAYLRSKGLQRPMLGAQRRTEARIGQLLGEPENRGPATVSHETRLIDRRHDRADFRVLAHGFDDANLTDDEWRKSRRSLVSLIRNRLGLLPETPDLPDGTFRVVTADPPWKLDTGPDVFGGTGEGGHDDLAYEQMSVESIKALDVEGRAADDAYLFLWTTNRYVESSYEVARAWGFKPSVLLVWAKKPRGVGLGDTFRLTTEFVLFARRGSLEHQQIVPRSWFDWPRGTHSTKPVAFYEMVESIASGPYLEMFARAPRDGWTVWGDEA